MAPTSQVPVSSEIAPTSEVPVSSEIAPTSEVPVSSEIAPTSEVPVSSEIAPTSEVPVSSEIAPTSEVPASSEIAPTSEVPVSSEMPPTSEVPVSSEMPSTSQVPVSSDMPSTSQVPVSSEMPSTSQVPVSSEMPSTSQVPVNPREMPEVKEKMYKTKIIDFFGRDTPIILQNDNGPCPLLAICNILLLKDKLGLNSNVTEVSQERLLALVAECLIDSMIKNKDAGNVEKQHQQVADAIDMLPGLAKGMNVNIRFRRIDDFEPTKEHAVFDLLNIPLYHGWLIDPNDFETLNAIGSKSYNTLMEELVALESKKLSQRVKYIADWVTLQSDPGEAEKTVRGGRLFDVGQPSSNEMPCGITAIQGELIREFLKESATQLTRYGLSRLHLDLLGCKICVFFRNNHFSTLFKFGYGLYILVTDQGYLNQPNVVWEKLTEINGDTEFMNSKFKSLRPPSPEIVEIGEEIDEKTVDEIAFDENTSLADIFEYLARRNKTADSDELFARALERQQEHKEVPESWRDYDFPLGFHSGPQNAPYSLWQPKRRTSLYRMGSKQIRDKCVLM